jgi:mono/diheme cytochrome c family protein
MDSRDGFRAGSIGLLGGGVLWAALAAAPAAPPAVSPAAAQVRSGLAVYRQHCQGCHGDKQQGGVGPALVGTQMLRDFSGPTHPYAELHGYVSKAMPLSAPGSLSAQQYLDVVAFVFDLNGVTLPAEGLTKDTLKDVALTARAAQIKAGQAVYTASCQGCHGDKLQGARAPTLLGAAFVKKWATVGNLHAKVSTTMPRNAPGSLSAQQYLDVVAFVLDQNKVVAGAAALGKADLAAPLK